MYVCMYVCMYVSMYVCNVVLIENREAGNEVLFMGLLDPLPERPTYRNHQLQQQHHHAAGLLDEEAMGGEGPSRTFLTAVPVGR